MKQDKDLPFMIFPLSERFNGEEKNILLKENNWNLSLLDDDGA